MTTAPSYQRVFDRLKAEVPEWGLLIETSDERLRELIADAGLSNQRADRLKRIVERLLHDFGEVSLAGLDGWDDDRVQEYLTFLPGVGVKTAKCVMMYTMGREVLPVDTHTARVAVRLGLVSAGNATSIDRDLSTVVRADRRFDFHVNAVAHGRATCRALRPRCHDCVLSSFCPVGRSAHQRTRREVRDGRR